MDAEFSAFCGVLFLEIFVEWLKFWVVRSELRLKILLFANFRLTLSLTILHQRIWFFHFFGRPILALLTDQTKFPEVVDALALKCLVEFIIDILQSLLFMVHFCQHHRWFFELPSAGRPISFLVVEFQSDNRASLKFSTVVEVFFDGLWEGQDWWFWLALGHWEIWPLALDFGSRLVLIRKNDL